MFASSCPTIGGGVAQPLCARPDSCYLAHRYATDYYFLAISQTSMHIPVASTRKLQARFYSRVPIYRHALCLLLLYTGHIQAPHRFAAWTEHQ